jgi:hypothetical protein
MKGFNNMEVRNITPAQSSPAFGMAFIKPSKQVMQVLEKQVDPTALEAFVKEQAKAKYFDITAKLDHSYRTGKNDAILFNVVPKEGVDTFGYGEKYGFHSEGRFDAFDKKIVDGYRKDMEQIAKSCNNGLKRFLFTKVLSPIASRAAIKDIKSVQLNHPERTVLPALRAAGDRVLELEGKVDRAAGISKIFEG